MCLLDNVGEIVGRFVDGHVHGFLTTPVPEPSSLTPLEPRSAAEIQLPHLHRLLETRRESVAGDAPSFEHIGAMRYCERNGRVLLRD